MVYDIPPVVSCVYTCFLFSLSTCTLYIQYTCTWTANIHVHAVHVTPKFLSGHGHMYVIYIDMYVL